MTHIHDSGLIKIKITINDDDRNDNDTHYNYTYILKFKHLLVATFPLSPLLINFNSINHIYIC